MRFSAGRAANVAALAVLGGLAAAAVVLVTYLGPFGLVLLGLLTLLVCTQFALDETAPTWGTEVFRAGMAEGNSPEQRAALAEARRAALSPARFYRGCGAVLVVAGLAGVAWQHWG